MSKTKSYVIELMLETSSNDDLVLEARFNIVHHMTNVMVKYAIGMLNQLKRDKEYTSILKNHKGKKLSKEDSVKLSEIRMKYGLSEYQFHSYIVAQKKDV